MFSVCRLNLFAGFCGVYVATGAPAAAQSRLNHERRINDLEAVTQEFVELQTGQALRWAEMEAQMQAQADGLNSLRAEVSALRRSLTARQAFAVGQQNRIVLLEKQAAILKAHLAAQESFGELRRQIAATSAKQSAAETFKARRPPPRAGGDYYRPTNAGPYGQGATAQRYVVGSAYRRQ